MIISKITICKQNLTTKYLLNFNYYLLKCAPITENKKDTQIHL